MSFLDRVRDLVPYVNKGFETPNLPDTAPRFLVMSKDGIVEKGWDELRSKANSIVSNANPGTLAPTITSAIAVNKYRSWIYDCVNIISRKGSTVKNYLYREIGEPDDEEFDKIRNHPLLNLVNKKSNRFLTGRELRQITHMHLDLTGHAFWWIIRDGLGQPAELHVLNPHDLIEVKMGDNTNELIKHFEFSPEEQSQRKLILPYDDVVYFHYPHPAKPLLACSPIQAVAHASDIDLYLQVYEKTFFQNDARPDFIIVAEQDITEAEAKRFYEAWNARHRGAGKSHKPAILNRNVNIVPLTMTANDFEFMALSEWTKDMILACYGIPEAMLGLYESFNKASSITAETTFVKECLDPRLRLMEDCINMQLLPQFRDSNGLEFRFESALPKDDEFQMTKDQADLTMGLTTINAIRKREGKKPYKSKLAEVPFMNGQPLPGEDEEADKLWANMMQPQMGMAGGMPGADPMAAMGGGAAGAIPEGGAVPPTSQPASNAPAAQGPMGQLGGRPPGGELKTLLQDALRSSKPGLSTLLNASAGKRGGLSGLLGSHPELHTFQELLNAKRNDQTLAKLLSKGVQEYIKKEYLEEDEWDIFDTHMEYARKWDDLEGEYKGVSEEFYVKKGMQFADIIEKALGSLVTKDSPWDIDEQMLKDDYKDSSKDFIEKAARIGFLMGTKLVEKAAGEPFDPIDASKEAAGRFLERSADLKVKSTRKAITKIVQHGIDQGWDSSRVAEMIRTEFKQIGGRRAELIARTELAGAIAEGTDASFKKINEDAGKIIVKGAQSWAVLDERTCKDPNKDKNCTYWNKKEVYDYENNTRRKEFPHHPGCRCLLKPIVGE